MNNKSLKEYIDYWDSWHKKWFEFHTKSADLDEIKGWSIPKNLGENNNEAYKYFPEPFYLIDINKNIDVIFLNINPGGGGPDQKFELGNSNESVLYKIFEDTKHKYSETIKKYLGKEGKVEKKNKKAKEIELDKNGKPKMIMNETAVWFNSKRLNWAKQLLANDTIFDLFDFIEEKNKNSKKGARKLSISDPGMLIKTIKETENNFKKINIEADIQNYNHPGPNILCADLIPWHSSKASDIQDYVRDNMKPIVDNVLFKLVKIASSIDNEKMKNKIIVRGVTFRNVVNSILEEKMKISDIQHYIVFKEKEVLDEFNSLLTVFTSNIEIQKEIIETRWYLFTGGSSMELPGLGNKYVIAGNKNLDERKRLRDFIFE